jgi:hypothetical protein
MRAAVRATESGRGELIGLSAFNSKFKPDWTHGH